MSDTYYAIRSLDRELIKVIGKVVDGKIVPSNQDGLIGYSGNYQRISSETQEKYPDLGLIHVVFNGDPELPRGSYIKNISV